MKLEEYLKRHSLTASEFARRANITVSTVHRAAAGTVIPSTETLQRIAEATNGAVQPNDFYSSIVKDVRSAAASTASGWRLGVDIGGTFTDLIVLEADGSSGRVEKVPTTPANLALGVMEGIDRLNIKCSDAAMIAHGTTVGLNAFLERKGAATGLITTAGFRDVYEIARHNRTETYDLFYLKPEPLVRRRYRLEVSERVDASGDVVAALNEADVRSCASVFRQSGIKSIAVCLINSYLNPTHEERVREILAEEYPEAAVTISSSLIRQWREYERTSTTVVNSYITPAVGLYLDSLEQSLEGRGYNKPLFVSQSAGGVISVSAARSKPVNTIMSGPSGGVIAAKYIAESLGRRNVITFDMGGTSTDVALVHEGKVKVAGEGILDRHPLLVSMIEIESIGAGGGSIARVSETGALEVGPESAGAVPGPICYRRGGVEPTVTDANLALGRLPAKHFLGGSMALDAAGSMKTIESKIAAPLGLTSTEAAAGILEVINVKMAYAVRAITIERGLDPKEFVLLPFGGAGPMHACAIARNLDIPEIIIPVWPGAFSAFGMLVSDVRHDFVRTYVTLTDGTEYLGPLDQAFAAMRAEAEDTLASEGVAPSDMVLDRSLDLRYLGQEYTVSVPVGSEMIDETAMISVKHRFHRLHERQYGHSSPEKPLEIVNLRLAASGLIPKLARKSMPAASETLAESAVLGETDAVFMGHGGALRTPLISRDMLAPGNVFEGPAIIVEQTATTVVEPGFQVQVLPTGELLIKREE